MIINNINVNIRYSQLGFTKHMERCLGSIILQWNGTFIKNIGERINIFWNDKN